MKRCPKCERFGVEYDPNVGHERCIWRNCPFINENDVDLDKYFEMYIAIHGTKFKKFKEALRKKERLYE